MKRLLLAALAIGLSSGAWAGNDGHPIRFDVQKEMAECMEMPIIKFQARDPVRACELITHERAYVETLWAGCMSEGAGEGFCHAVVNRYVAETAPGVMNKALTR